jgi:hypothetical protein
MSDYNGWTNYATWRVNLEMFDGLDLKDMGWHRLEDRYDLANTLKDYADEMLTINGETGLAVDYARAFLSDVDWHDIARSMIDVYQDAYDQQAADESDVDEDEELT